MNKGQGSIEYLLILGGVIMVAVIVIALIVNIATPAGTQTKNDTADLFCSRKPITGCCGQTVAVQSTTYTCYMKSDNTLCATQSATSLVHCCNSLTDLGETDLDCGGTCGKTCISGKTCTQNSDCISGTCTGTPLKCA
ncbi:MAG: class III signal peptide-containing protein [archaeon]